MLIKNVNKNKNIHQVYFNQEDKKRSWLAFLYSLLGDTNDIDFNVKTKTIYRIRVFKFW
ncbi:Uncharacterised protein [Mycoplasmopsis bovirhinis]|uniref:Uncharacterized protein n=1 Tax=Mycoplasmopsis bovirhinis TaxID=29553 RepID=A0A449AD49_9BACT|nr:Uncharacterised protein [Mycoplasmopsis bovirhinis]